MSTHIEGDGLHGISKVAGVNGVLRGILDDELPVWDAVPDAEIVAVPVREPSPPGATGASRRGVVQVPHDRVAKETAAPGALSGRTDDHGRFALATRESYAGFWRLYACFSAIRAPGAGTSSPLGREVCFDLGVYPARKPIAADVPRALYCTLKCFADQWTVFGRVTQCATGEVISGAVVSAFDTDWLQDDALGSSVSNGAGIYRIDYPGSAFRRGSYVDVELFGGPDLHFRVTGSGGSVLIDEPPGAGRTPGRADCGHCAHVDLCSQAGAPPGGAPPGATRRDSRQ